MEGEDILKGDDCICGGINYVGKSQNVTLKNVVVGKLKAWWKLIVERLLLGYGQMT